jgi:nonsense-mediated mRNA decay protein 3
VFCVECGKEGELIGSLCEECYSKKHVQPSIPDHVDLTICAHCQSMQTPKGWEDVGSIREAAETAIEDAIVLPKETKVSDLRVHLSEKDERNLQARVEVMLVIQGHQFSRELGTIVRLKRGSCAECSKQQGKYYEAILQVRGQERNLPKDVEQEIDRFVTERVGAMRKSSREVFLSKVAKVKGGLDFYFSTISSARGVSRDLQDAYCAEYKESSSLWGRRDGKDIYRMTYLVRLPGMSKGDIVLFEGRELYVRGMSRGMLHVIDLKTGEERSVRFTERTDCALSQPRPEIVKAVVLAEKDNELQVLDPETMKPLEVRKPRGFSRKGQQVRLVKTKLGAYVLSDSW